MKVELSAATYVAASNRNVSQLPAVAQSGFGLYVDLSGNQLPASALSRLGRNITCLNLNSNPLASFALPLLRRLRSLTLDKCGLTSFSGIPSLIDLRFLSVAGNNLRSYEGLRITPRLVHLDLSGNPLDFSPVLTVQAFGSIYLKTFNGAPLSRRQLGDAFALSPLVGVALRKGRAPAPLGSADHELEASVSFLHRDLIAFVRAQNSEATVTPLAPVPIDDGLGFVLQWDSPSIKWLRSHSPIHGPEWVPVIREPTDASPPNILPITQLLQMHMLKCEFGLGDRTFTIYTAKPIGHKPGQLSLPFPLDPGVTGLPIEGSLISMIPLDVPARVEWSCAGGPIARDVPSIMLTHHEVDNNVTCFLEPYSPYFDTLCFSVVYAETDVVDAQLPVVSEVVFPSLIVEGDQLVFTRTMFPDREGDSVIFIERSKSVSEEWVQIAPLEPGHMVYSPTVADIGSFLRINYTPQTAQGVVGQTVYSYSDTRVLPAIPSYKQAVLGGFPKSFHPMAALGDYVGGSKGKCKVTWYFSKTPFTEDNLKQGQLVAEDTLYFTPGEEHVDGYLATEMIPVRNDDVVGDSVFAVLEKPLVKAQPFPPFPDPPTEAREGVKITVPDTVSFFLSNTRAFCGFTEVKRGVSFTPRPRDVGRVLRIASASTEVIVGEVLPADPVVNSLVLDYEKAQVGITVTAVIDPSTIVPERCDIIWMKVDGLVVRAISFNTTSYVFAPEDIGFQIKVRVTPIDLVGQLLPFTESALTPPVAPAVLLAPTIVGFLVEGSMIRVSYARPVDRFLWLRSHPEKKWISTKVTTSEYPIGLADIGRYLRAELTVGDATLIATSSDVVRPLPPTVAVTAERVTATEGEVLTPGFRYEGGREGDSVLVWRRIPPGAVPAALPPPSRLSRLTRTVEDDGTTILGTSKTYQVTAPDVGSRIEFSYTPVRSDGAAGDSVTLLFGPVVPLPPSVSDVKIQQNAQGNIECTGVYRGGDQGASIYEWRARDHAGKRLALGASSVNWIQATPDIAGSTVEAFYCPVRFDGVRGQAVRSNQLIVQALPTVLSLEILTSEERVTVSSHVRCRAAISPGSSPTFQWFRGKGDGTWLKIEGAAAADYIVEPENLGLYLLCSVTAQNDAGWKGQPLSAVTAEPVEAAELDTLRIIVHKNRFETGVEMRTSAKGDVVWEREVGGTWEFIVENPVYLTTIADVGHRIRAAAGEDEAPPTPPIVLRPALVAYAKAAVGAKQLRFVATSIIGKAVWNVLANAVGLTMKGKGTADDKSGKWGNVMWEAVTGTRDAMTLWLDRSTKFRVLVAITGDQRTLVAIGEHARDYICATFAEFARAAGVR